jgi:hypothetical protein
MRIRTYRLAQLGSGLGACGSDSGVKTKPQLPGGHEPEKDIATFVLISDAELH